MNFNCLNILKNYGFKPKKILDIGAYHGNWSLTVQKIFSDSEFTLVEAIDYNELSKFNNMNNYKCYNCVLSDIIEEVDWYQKCNTGDSMFRENTPHFHDCQVLKKKTNTLDNLFIDEVYDLIKIDVQGAELKVLKGGTNLVKQTSFIILELPFMGEYNKDAPNFKEYINYMDSINFIPYEIIEVHKHKEIMIQIDIIFINKNHKFNDFIQNKINNFI